MSILTQRSLDKKLVKAERAYKNYDRRAGAKLVMEILRQDYHHQKTWQLLYQVYGSNQSFEEFQQLFSEKYFPERLPEPDNGILIVREEAETNIKHSLKDRLRGFFRRNKEPETSMPEEQTQPAADIKKTVIPTKSSSKSSIHRIALNTGRKKATQDKSISPAPEPERSNLSTLPPAPQPNSSVSSSIVKPRASPIAESTVLFDDNKIRVLVVDDIDLTRENVIRALQFEETIEVVDIASNGAQAIEMARQHYPDVILMDVNMPDMDGITATYHIRRELPATQIIILTVQDDTDYIRQSMVAGARDFLTKPPRIEELVTAVQNAYKYSREAREKELAIYTSKSETEKLTKTGHVITVYSPRGGAGCSMIATNLAASLNANGSSSVLVDGDLQFGDIPVLLNMQSSKSILELTQRANELNDALVQEVVAEHESGIFILAPPGPKKAEQVTGDQFSRVLEYLSYYYSYVIVDTTHRLLDSTLAAFDISDLVVLVTTQDVPSIARIRRFLDIANLMNIDPRRLFTVMNWYDKRVDISPKKVGEIFKHEISATIPKDIVTVYPSINRGTPFMLNGGNRSRPIFQAMDELVNGIRTRIEELDASKEEIVETN